MRGTLSSLNPVVALLMVTNLNHRNILSLNNNNNKNNNNNNNPRQPRSGLVHGQFYLVIKISQNILVAQLHR